MIDKMKKAKSIVIAVLTVFLIAAIFIITMITYTGCMSSPDREDYKTEACFNAADCDYRNKENKDKAYCAGARDDCVDANKENRIKERLTFCNNTLKRGDLTAKECRYELNQK